ncbi:MAG: fluoride efflux transporter CrcB [Alphaproteobacteria bacterium HGW-Alphaproteobacteria-14]|nr:MAG: fluoride efflux transporter CrcB [Alphaproteobacteria bacterium HGW-Alphaproteobacteria-14]
MNPSALSPFAASTLVASGGAAGALARYQLGRAVTHLAGPSGAFPWGTLTVNLLGSLAMGALLGWLARGSVSTETTETMHLLIGIGLLGGFTTFSAFSSELVAMIHRGQILLGLAYGSASLIAGMAAIIVGLIIAQSAS